MSAELPAFPPLIWMVFGIVNGQVLGGSYHVTEQAALREAELLAKVYPRCSYGVAAYEHLEAQSASARGEKT